MEDLFSSRLLLLSFVLFFTRTEFSAFEGSLGALSLDRRCSAVICISTFCPRHEFSLAWDLDIFGFLGLGCGFWDYTYSSFTSRIHITGVPRHLIVLNSPFDLVSLSLGLHVLLFCWNPLMIPTAAFALFPFDTGGLG